MTATRATKAPPDRLTQGLVRDELRQYRYALHRPKQAIVALFEFLEARVGHIFAQGRRLTEAQRRALRRDTDIFIRDRFRPFSSQVTRQPLAGIEANQIELHGYHYTNPRSYMLRRIGDIPEGSDATFEEEGVEFRYLRFAISARRVIVDDFSCHISFSFHTLMRIVARCGTNHPIAYLRERAIDFLPFVALNLTGSIALRESRQVAIPLPGGLVVGDLARNEGESLSVHHRRRLILDHDACGLSETPMENIFADPSNFDALLTIRTTTFIDNDNLGDLKTWAKSSLAHLMDQHPQARDVLFRTLIAPETSSHKEGELRKCVDLMLAYSDLIDQQKWQRALRQ